MITSSQLSAHSKVKHGFFTRWDGVSGGVYRGLNCGYGSGDDNANIDQNRAIAMAKLGIMREDLNTLYQIQCVYFENSIHWPCLRVLFCRVLMQ